MRDYVMVYNLMTENLGPLMSLAATVISDGVGGDVNVYPIKRYMEKIHETGLVADSVKIFVTTFNPSHANGLLRSARSANGEMILIPTHEILSKIYNDTFNEKLKTAIIAMRLKMGG